MSFEKIINEKKSKILFQEEQKHEQEKKEREKEKQEMENLRKKKQEEYEIRQSQLEQNPLIEKIRAMVNDPRLEKALRYMVKELDLDYSPKIEYTNTGVYISMIWGLKQYSYVGDFDNNIPGGEDESCECKFELEISIDENGKIYSGNCWEAQHSVGRSHFSKKVVQNLDEILEDMAEVFIERGGADASDHWGLRYMAKNARK